MLLCETDNMHKRRVQRRIPGQGCVLQYRALVRAVVCVGERKAAAKAVLEGREDQGLQGHHGCGGPSHRQDLPAMG
jgi:hypothetical protein